MTDSKENTNNKWRNLDWEKKVTICNQTIANEDSLFLTLVIMFLAFEAILFTILIGVGWGQWWSIILASFGVVLVPFFVHFFYVSGNALDLWGEILHGLWEEVDQQELAQNYEGCIERRIKRQEKHGWQKVIFGWCETDKRMGRFKRVISWFKCFSSKRKWFTTFIPLIIVIVWILLMAVSFNC